MNAAEGLAAVGPVIAACRHGDRAATDYEIGCGPRRPAGMSTARAGGGTRVPARFGGLAVR